MISSFCGMGGGWDCVDVEFKKSSFCQAAGNCIEVGVSLPDGTVLVRDTKDRTKPPLEFTYPEWGAFVQGVKAGEFDLPDGSVGGDGGDT